MELSVSTPLTAAVLGVEPLTLIDRPRKYPFAPAFDKGIGNVKKVFTFFITYEGFEIPKLFI